MQRACGLLRFYGGVASVNASENATFRKSVAAKQIGARATVLAVVAVGAEAANSHAK